MDVNKQKQIRKSIKQTHLKIEELEEKIEQSINYDGYITVTVIDNEIRYRRDQIEEMLNRKNIIPNGITMAEILNDMDTNHTTITNCQDSAVKILDACQRLQKELIAKQKELSGMPDIEEQVRSRKNKELLINKSLREIVKLTERKKQYKRLASIDTDCTHCKLYKYAKKAKKRIPHIQEKIARTQELIELLESELNDLDTEDKYRYWLWVNRECARLTSSIDKQMKNLSDTDAMISSCLQKDKQITDRIQQRTNYLQQEKHNAQLNKKIEACHKEISILEEVKQLCYQRDQLQECKLIKLKQRLLKNMLEMYYTEASSIG